MPPGKPAGVSFRNGTHLEFAVRLSWFLLGLFGLVTPASTLGMEVACANPAVSIAGWTQADAEEICLSVQDALRLLDTLGLPYPGGLVVRPFDSPAPLENGHPLGLYDPRTNTIRILPYDQAVRNTSKVSPFEVTMSRALWRSYFAHELAHAVAERHFAPGVPRLTATEYIAAVVQLMALPDVTRDQILATYTSSVGWNSAAEITATYYFIDPSRFAVKSYRHYMALAPIDRRAFIGRLLSAGAGR